MDLWTGIRSPTLGLIYDQWGFSFPSLTFKSPLSFFKNGLLCVLWAAVQEIQDHISHLVQMTSRGDHGNTIDGTSNILTSINTQTAVSSQLSLSPFLPVWCSA